MYEFQIQNSLLLKGKEQLLSSRHKDVAPKNKKSPKEFIYRPPTKSAVNMDRDSRSR
jgi:hypothetical protein